MARSKDKDVLALGATLTEAVKDDLRPGYLLDYISGRSVKDTPEERDAVQVFAKRLVEDYGYSPEQIQTHPQFRVRKSPSDKAKSYPVDIAVFKSSKKIEDELLMVVECKKKTGHDGETQLKLYLDMSSADLGVWFNGHEHIYLRKIHSGDGDRTYDYLPNIPRCGQRLQDIGRYKKSELKKPSNLKAVFRDIRNHLAGMAIGVTRDEPIAKEIINVLFCKILDERDTAWDEAVAFRAGVNESADAVRKRILGLFEKVKTKAFSEVFDDNDVLTLDAQSLRYVVGELQNYSLMEADRDAIGDAFEVFIGPALRGAEGQFFTPRNVVRMMVDMLNPKPDEMIIDPACGSGGFLITALQHVWKQLDQKATANHWGSEQLVKQRIEVASNNFRGVDKDSFLAKVCKAYMSLVGDGRGGVFCGNTLVPTEEWSANMRDKIKPGTFDVVLTNPPFGKNIVVKGPRTLAQYDLGYKWKRNKKTNDLEKTSDLHDDQPPQILFLERCLQLLRPGGRMAIVLPESVFGMPTYENVVTLLRTQTKIRALVTMPESLFKTSGKGGTHAKVCVLIVENTPPRHDEDYEIFMADAKWCGHDSRANPTYRRKADGTEELLDDVPTIAEKYHKLMGGRR